MLLRQLDPREIARVDWDRIVVEKSRPYRRLEIALDDPLAFTREKTAALFARRTQKETT